MNRYKILDIIRRTSIVQKRDFYLHLMGEPSLNSLALSMQKDNLTSFLKRLRGNAFYGPLLNKVTDLVIESSPYDVLRSFPLTDKELLTKNYNLVRNSSIPGESGYTGGSTGSPFHYFSGKKMLSSLTGYTMFLWSYLGGFEWEDNTIVVGGASIGEKESLKKNILHKLQRRTFISGGEITEENAVKLSRSINEAAKPVILYGYPSSICQYVNILERNNIPINSKRVKRILTTSEMLSDEKKFKLEDYFQNKVVNLYGARDGGISAGSTDNKTFIYNGIDCVAESVEIDGITELVLTNLDSDAFPFVRYRIGDVAEPITLSEGYPFVLKNLEGRTRDFINMGAQKRIHGSRINSVFNDLPIAEYQVLQYKDLSCDVRIQPSTTLTEEELSLLYSRLNVLLNGIPLNIQVVDTLIREKNNKLKNIISEVS